MSVVDSILSCEKKKKAELYEVLGCDRTASTEQIQAEYRARVRDAHPDKATVENRDEANAAFKKLQNAYSVLTDGAQRKVYDMWLDSPMAMTFDEFARNQDAIKMSMHWVTPRQQQMLGEPASTSPPDVHPSTAAENRWGDGRRHESDAAAKFRAYQL